VLISLSPYPTPAHTALSTHRTPAHLSIRIIESARI